MRWRWNSDGVTRVFGLVIAAGVIGVLMSPRNAAAEDRKFAVMLAFSPKAFDADGTPGLPDGGLPSVSSIDRQYFDRLDPTIRSFAEYWEEVSYGDVTITGRAFGWVTVPWPFEPNSPNGRARPSPADYTRLHTNSAITVSATTLVTVPSGFAYGAGEDFCDAFSSGDTTVNVSLGRCGALIIQDYVGNRINVPPPKRGPGLNDFPAVGMNVWTPGERFLDLDGDGRWDGIDEVNDQICFDPSDPTKGCSGTCTPGVCSISLEFCAVDNPCGPGDGKCIRGGRCSTPTGAFDTQGNGRFFGCFLGSDCPPAFPICKIGGSGERCGSDGDCTDRLVERCGDPPGSGARGCDTPGCGSLAMPCIDFDGDGTCNNPQSCVVPNTVSQPACTTDDDPSCPSLLTLQPDGQVVIATPKCLPVFPPPLDLGGNRICRPTNCVPSGTTLPPCCSATVLPPGCIQPGPTAPVGVACDAGSGAIECCEFDDYDGDGSPNVVEPFEDFMIRWNPSGTTAATVWTRVSDEYIRNNYPGDVNALLARTGNGFYDPPDLFIDRGDSKMMQDAGLNQFSGRTPKPGARYSAPPVSEKPWFDQWWSDTYGTTAPAWPGGSGASPAENSPRMREFDPANPVPPVAAETPGRIWFQPDRGGVDDHGNGTAIDDFTAFSDGGDNFTAQVLPEERFGFYDGWVEHDDLASSKYHRSGDLRLGEITSPTTDTVLLTGDPTPYPAIFGVDIGVHNPDRITTPDGYKVAAGPYAVNIHGEKGYDAGDVCIVEWLTWRTDGTSPTIAYRWESDHGAYHPFAGPKRCSVAPYNICTQDSDCAAGICSFGSAGLGFRDYDLNGMIDQGEVRPLFSENYSADADPTTADDGTHTNYPFNRQRLVEDVVEALDPSIDWDEFNDANALATRQCVAGSNVNRKDRFDFRHLKRTTGSNPDFASNPNSAKRIDAEGFVSGIVIAPSGSYSDNDLFPLAPKFYPVHNEDNDDPTFMYPDWGNDPFDPNDVHISNNLFFHDLVICADCRPGGPSVTPYAAHEYGHTWEGWPDLYDYDVFLEAPDGSTPFDEENCPIGAWDLMAGGSAGGGLVHSIPILKAATCTDWIDPIDLTTVVTPGVTTTVTLPPAELVRNGSYYYLENPERSRERYWLWSAGKGFDEPRTGGGLPGTGLLILHTDNQANSEGLPLQQRTEPWSYVIVQADGRNDLEACTTTGNGGDNGDPWPGSSENTTFNFDTNPPAVWNGEQSWTGLDISNIVQDSSGGAKVTLTWVPTNIPSLRFLQPPGGETVRKIYQVRFQATDVYGGTRIQLFATPRTETGLVFGTNAAQMIGEIKKTIPGTVDMSFDWDITGFKDGSYFLFAKLIPEAGADGTEAAATPARKGPGNKGDGKLTVNSVSIDGDAANSDDKARSETWTVKCINAAGTKWKVVSTLSYPENANDDPLSPAPELTATTGQVYDSPGGEVRFTITKGTKDFSLGDTFTFTTTGYTAKSRGIEIKNGRITEGPTAVLDADTFTGPPPLEVRFDARRSTDPNNQPLNFEWDFGDGTAPVAGDEVTHKFENAGTFTVQLTATNPLTTRFDVAVQDIIVINNKPKAKIKANPSSGKPPLTVQFNADESSDKETKKEDLVYQWDFGDGKTANDAGVPGVLITTEHFYSTRANGTACTAANPCTFVAQLTVTDGNGAEGQATVEILVGNSRPLPIVNVDPVDGPAPLEVTFDASGTFDPDTGDTVTANWTWGDGSVTNNVSVSSGSKKFVHTYQQPGTYQPTAVLRDQNGATVNWTGPEIKVTGNQAPVAVATVTPKSGDQNKTQFTFDGSQSRDADGSIKSYSWNFGDGTPAASGAVVTHTFAKASATGFTVTLTVKDDRDATAKDTLKVVVNEEPENRGPVAHIATLPQACAVPCTVTLDGSLSFDPDDDPLLYEWTIVDEEGITNTTQGQSVLVRNFGILGTYYITLTVTESGPTSQGLSDTVGPVEVMVVPAGTTLPEPTEPEPTNPTPTEPPDSANQRPNAGGICGLGMVMSLFGSLFGLTAMAVARRRKFRY